MSQKFGQEFGKNNLVFISISVLFRFFLCSQNLSKVHKNLSESVVATKIMVAANGKFLGERTICIHRLSEGGYMSYEREE